MGNLAKEEWPPSFFVFVNQLSPMTWNNFNVTGHFASAAVAATTDEELAAAYEAYQFDFLPFLPNSDQFPMVSPFVISATAEYRVEYDAETGRRAYAPEAPSRLSAVYAFGTYG